MLEEYPEAKADLEKRAKKTLKRYGGDENRQVIQIITHYKYIPNTCTLIHYTYTIIYI